MSSNLTAPTISSRGIDPRSLAHLELLAMQTGVADPAGGCAPQSTAVFYSLRSILEPIPLSTLFPSLQPLEVELGSGDGSFLVAYARGHLERNCLGVERLLGRARKLERKTLRAGLNNLRVVRIESSYFLKYLLPPHAASALHIYFPDPWPKRKHRARRLVNDTFPALARNALAPGGMVFLRTDDADYFEQMQRAFGASPDFSPAETPAELVGLLTDFETGFRAQGKATLRAAYQARPQ